MRGLYDCSLVTLYKVVKTLWAEFLVVEFGRLHLLHNNQRFYGKLETAVRITVSNRSINTPPQNSDVSCEL